MHILIAFQNKVYSIWKLSVHRLRIIALISKIVLSKNKFTASMNSCALA